MTSNVFRDLPASNVQGLLEVAQAEAISDRFTGGGLSAGGDSQLVASLGSRRQTRYRIGDIDVTSPLSGQPLFFPELAFWSAIGTTTGLMPAGLNVPSLAVDLEPARPAVRWTATAEWLFSGASLVSASDSQGVPAVARLRDWTHGSLVVGGPLGSRGGVLVGAAISDSVTLTPQQPGGVRAQARSLILHDVFTPAPDRELRTVGWVQTIHAPSPHATMAEPDEARDSALHVQSTFVSSDRQGQRWRVFAAYSERRRNEALPSSPRAADRLLDGPVPDLIASRHSTERRWSIGGRVAPVRRPGRHKPDIGVDYAAAAVRQGPLPGATIAESIDRLPSRVWIYAPSPRESRRHVGTFAIFASDRIHVSSTLSLDAALSYELVSGAADGAAAGIVWHSLLPRAAARWSLGTPARLVLISGYRRAANHLTLDLLSTGDPAGPYASIFRWDNGVSSPSLGPLVARAGPGTGGDETFSAIDLRLRRPHTDEFAIGLESSPSRTARLAVTGIARREASLVNMINAGVPATAYRVFYVPDANVDLVGTGDDRPLPVYERLPESFGHDRYVLTNPAQEPATMGALVVSAEVTTPRLFLNVGATASASVGQGANRGFRASENDQDAIGELFTTPNAATNARGRLFSDRAYTIKWTTVYRFVWDIRLGAIARYEDGQPFSRLVIVPGLAQGVEAIQAFANGRSRFAFTGTLDVRLQKGFSLGSRRVDAIADVYNLLDMRKEVEEYVVTGDRFRTPTAVQPPRAVHLGFRITF
jgi:hypothetical protein